MNPSRTTCIRKGIFMIAFDAVACPNWPPGEGGFCRAAALVDVRSCQAMKWSATEGGGSGLARHSSFSSVNRSGGLLVSDHGGILKDLGDLTSSAQSYEAAIRLDPHLVRAHLNLAVIRNLKVFSQSDYPGSFPHYQVALSLDPKNQLIIVNMG
ncbi:hypothetical protein MRX96_058114 [Rhipicephalus microplus]